MTSQVTDVLEAVQSFVAKGYDREYRVRDAIFSISNQDRPSIRAPFA